MFFGMRKVDEWSLCGSLNEPIDEDDVSEKSAGDVNYELEVIGTKAVA